MESKSDRTVVIAVVTGVVALLLGLCLGALAGGFGGYFIGRQAAGRAFETPEQPRLVPTTPAWPEMPEMPGLPEMPGPEFRGLIPPGVQGGALVEEVIKGTPADDAGLEVGDLITQVDATPVDATHRLADVIGQYQPGNRVTLKVWRFGETRTIKVKLGQHPDDARRAYLGIKYTDFGVGERAPEPGQ